MKCIGPSPTCTETLAPVTGLLWESRTFPEIPTVSPCTYCALSVETVIDRDPCENTSGATNRTEITRSNGNSLSENASGHTCAFVSLKWTTTNLAYRLPRPVKIYSNRASSFGSAISPLVPFTITSRGTSPLCIGTLMTGT